MDRQKILLVDAQKYLDALSLGEFIESVTEVMKRGWGKVTFEVTVIDGNVKTVTITKQNTLRVAGENKKE